MMSSEEDPDLGGGDKKPKRVRQRVDAGEPRNSYASIPNYSPRLYPPNGYGKMLCDLGVLSNGKSSSEMVVLESNGGFGSPERCSSSGGSSDSHLLRDILQQGRHGPVGSPPDFRPPEPHSDDSNDSKASKMSVGGGGVNAAGAAPQEPPSAGGAADLKRARVETIVSNMMVRTPVNGCKKRKLYQPQQHERPASEEDDEEPCSSPKRRPSSAGLFTFRQQLRHMQQQLVQMQQQYMEMVDGEDSADEVEAKPNCFNDDDSASLYEDSGRKLVVDCDPQPPKDGGGERQTCIVPPAPVDIGWLAESLKAELSTSLSQVVDAVVSRCVQRKAAACKGSPPTETSTPKDPTLLSQMLDRKSPRTGGKVVDRGARVNGNSPFPADSAPPPPQPPPRPPFLFPLKPSVAATAAFLYGSPPSYAPSPPHDSSAVPEQTEAMSLVVSNKKKRHKVTDTRLNRLCPGEASPKYGGLLPPDPGMYHHHHPPPPPLVPVSLPTTVAIPNPSLNQSELFHGFGGYDPHRFGPPMDDDDGGPPQVPLHALMPFHAGPHHRGSPDQMHPHHLKQDSTGDMSDTGDSPAGYDNGMAMISFLPGSMHTSTLTPMHLRKAKLMFFYARYPSSAVLKMYFPDIRFNKNNTAQLVKWFSNFREFFYIQMEKYARQAITEGVKNAEDLKVDADSELLRVLNLHYNRNNHIPAPHTFRNVVEQTLREFYKALVAGKDSEQSWKKSIYKIIARLDDSVPDYFKSPDFFDKLE